MKEEETNSDLKLNMVLNLDSTGNVTQQQPPGIKVDISEVSPQIEEATSNVQPLDSSNESDYYSAQNFELQTSPETDNGDNDSMIVHLGNYSYEDEFDVDISGYDDPRLPEMII